MAIDGSTVTVTVHSLGAKPVSGGVVTLVAENGKVLASAPIPALAAPTDLRPKTTRVDLAIPRGAVLAGAAVRVALPDKAREVTMLNNVAPLPVVRR